jgi:hypothetical protein
MTLPLSLPLFAEFRRSCRRSGGSAWEGWGGGGGHLVQGGGGRERERRRRRDSSHIRVAQGILGRDAVFGVENKESLHQIEGFLAGSRDELLEGEGGPDREGVVPVLERGHSRPEGLRGRPKHSGETRVRRSGERLAGGEGRGPEDLEELIDLRVAREERSLGDHLSQDAAHAPEVGGKGIGAASKQDLRGAVPESDHLVGEGADGRDEGSREPEVSQL